jgi:hypothetical protein
MISGIVHRPSTIDLQRDTFTGNHDFRFVAVHQILRLR